MHCNILILRMALGCILIGTALASCTTARTELSRGITMDMENRPDIARMHYTRAIAMDSTLSDAFYNRALLFYRDGRYNEALADFSQVVRLQPRDHTAWFYRARSHAAIGQYDNAISDHTHQIDINPYSAQAHYLRGDLYRILRRYTNAFDDFSIALTFDQYMYWVYGGRARTWLDMDSTTAAFADCSAAIGIAVELLEDLENAGYNRYWNPKWPPNTSDSVKQAALQQEQTLHRQRLGEFYNFRGHISLTAGNYERAIEDFRTTLQWNASDARAYGNMGWCYYLLNDFERCITLSETAVRYDGNALFARYNRALAMLRLHRFGEAQEAYRETKDYSDFLIKEGKYQEPQLSPEAIPVFLAETVASATDGAIGDLRALLKENIQADEARRILRDVFGIEH